MNAFEVTTTAATLAVSVRTSLEPSAAAVRRDTLVTAEIAPVCCFYTTLAGYPASLGPLPSVRPALSPTLPPSLPPFSLPPVRPSLSPSLPASFPASLPASIHASLQSAPPSSHRRITRLRPEYLCNSSG